MRAKHAEWDRDRILLVSNCELVKLGVDALFSTAGKRTIIADASSADEVLDRLGADRFIGMVLVDSAMGDSNGSHVVEVIKDADETLPIAFLGEGSELLVDILRLFSTGVRGLIPRTENALVMVAACNLIMSGGCFIPEQIIAPMQAWNRCATGVARLHGVPVPASVNINRGTSADRLTDRQLDVVKLLVQGKSNKEIARELSISPGTVKNHIAAILGTLGISSRVGVVSLLLQRPDSAHKDMVA